MEIDHHHSLVMTRTGGVQRIDLSLSLEGKVKVCSFLIQSHRSISSSFLHLQFWKTIGSCFSLNFFFLLLAVITTTFITWPCTKQLSVRHCAQTQFIQSAAHSGVRVCMWRVTGERSDGAVVDRECQPTHLKAASTDNGSRGNGSVSTLPSKFVQLSLRVHCRPQSTLSGYGCT